jgi:CAP12/Pycsar effector protein, TIR domain
LPIEPRIYVSASRDEYLSDAQCSIKRSIYERIKDKNFEPWGYFEEGPLRRGWGFSEANTAMEKCQGAIILAFARWECKGLSPTNEDGLKASEGNHFEGGLAIAHGVPLLVVKEEGTQERGILAEDPSHAVVPMPRGSTAEWVEENRLFNEEFARWCQEVKERSTRHKQRNVFIGHGHSQLWRSLRDFVETELRLRWDEFNRLPIAGMTNIERLSQMLEEAGFAFLVMTAEDEQRDGTFRARMNVIHEAGLLQGRLGFRRAIVVLEEGCEEFSNMHGVGQIRFPKGNIGAVFPEIRQILEREGLYASKDAV